MANWFMSEWTGHLWIQQLQNVSSWLIHGGLTSQAWEEEMTRPLPLFKVSLNTLRLEARRELANYKGMPKWGAGSRALLRGL